MLDAIGPYEVLKNLPKAEVFFVAEKKGEITSDAKTAHLVAKYSIEEINEADILVIPGSAITFLREINNQKVMNWITDVDKTTEWTTSVCSGSIILAATGALKGLKATSHWKALKMLQSFGALPVNGRFIKQGKYITAAGVSAGIDMALYLCNEIDGKETTQAIQLFIEYDPHPIYDSGNHEKANADIINKAESMLIREAKKEPELFELIKGKM